ncbi:hypothetical protein HWV62_2926 [Athelia sp. TMB]|nr:hypothetical protein HWV62_2926 [Athelia sp. TMB]
MNPIKTCIKSLLKTPPMIWIPDDVLSYMFQIYVDSHSAHAPHTLPAPMILATVCKQWRTLCINSPRLWVHISIYPYGHQNLAVPQTKLFELFVSRSGTCPLHVEIATWIVTSYGHQSAPHYYRFDVHGTPSLRRSDLQILISAMAASAGRWQNLALKCHCDFITQLCQALSSSAMPLLKAFSVESNEPYTAMEHPLDSLVPVPEQLRYLKVAFHSRDDFQALFDALELPSLRCLHVVAEINGINRCVPVWPQLACSRFLNRSSCKLQMLVLDLLVIDQYDLLVLLRSAALVSLVEIELVEPRKPIRRYRPPVLNVALLENLDISIVRAASVRLPNLRVISFITAHFDRSFLLALTKMLQSRTLSGHVSLQHFNFQYNSPRDMVNEKQPVNWPSGKEARALRSELAHTNLDIRISVNSWDSVANWGALVSGGA